MLSGVGGLEYFLNYELRCSVRYRRFVSIVMIACDNGRILKQWLYDSIIRESDEVFEIEEGYSILMGDTDRTGALTAVERLSTHCKGEADLYFAVVSFPVDGNITAELLASGHRRLRKARALQPGAIVATD